MSVLLLWSLRASGVIAVGLLLALALRGRSAALRNLVLRLTLAVACALPALASFAPRLEVPLAPPAPAPSVPRVPATFQSPTPLAEGESGRQPDPRGRATLGLQRATPFSTRMVPTPLPLFVWSAGIGFLLLRWAAGVARLRRLRHAATRTDEPDVYRAAIAVPATYGRTILVPLEVAEWPEARLQAAILHERAHVARRDWHWQTLAGLFAAVQWPNPLAWLLARLLRDAAEAAADDAVLAQGVAPSAYARELLAVAAKVGPTGPALAMARRGGVADRVAAILASGRDRRGPSRQCAVAYTAAMLATGVVIGGIALASKAAATGIQKGASSPKAALPGGGSLRLLAIREPSTTSVAMRSPSGGPLAARDEALLMRTLLRLPQGFFAPPPGMRRLQFLFVSSETSVDPTQFTLSRKGGDILQPAGSASKTVPGVGALFAVHCDVPVSLDLVDLEAQFPAGPWRREPAPWPMTVDAHEDVEAEGRRIPVQHVEARPADFSAGRSYRLVVKDSKGRTLQEADDIGFGEGRIDGLVPKGTPLGRLAVESRPIVHASFPNVRLRPSVAPNPVPLAKGRSVELAGVWSPDGTSDPWRPDGSKGGVEGVGNYDGTVPTGMRAVLFAVRVRGSATRVPTVQVRPDHPGATFARSSLSLLREEPGSHLVWVRTVVPQALSATGLDVDLKLDIDDAGPPLPLGAKRGQATVAVKSVDARPTASYAQLRVTPHVPMDPSRFWYGVSPVDAHGGSPESFGYDEEGPTFRISMAHPERAVAWRLWKAPRVRVRFEGVRLRPNS